MVCINVESADVLTEECLEGRSFGFTGKQVIHPSQIPLVNQAFSPSAEDIVWAKRVLLKSHKNAFPFVLDGTVIDEPCKKYCQLSSYSVVLLRARHILGWK